MTYRVTGELYDGAGTFLGHASWSEADATATLQFDIEKSTSPYTLERLRLFGPNGALLDSRHYKAYQITKLDGPVDQGAIALSEPPADSSGQILPLGVIPTDAFTTTTVDQDGDGRYDQLVIDVGVVVTDTGGDYRVEGLLVDERGAPVAWSVSDPQTLSLGPQALELAFDGRVLHDHMLLSPMTQTFTLVDVKIFAGDLSTSTLEDKVDVATTTPAYTRDDFEPANSSYALFEDDMEGETSLWSWATPWSLNDSLWSSWSHAWRASSSGTDGALRTTASLDLLDYAEPALRFKTAHDMQLVGDVGYLQISTNGVDWSTIATYDDTTPHWTTELVDLSDYSETSDVQFRFNADAQSDLLWYVDDVFLNAWPAVTTATFDYGPQPVLTDEDITFVADYTSIDTTTLPITYTWDFGDDSSILVTTEPTVTHAFTEGIEHTVYLTVENPYDDALFSDAVPVYEPVSETSFDFTPASDASDWKTVFTTAYTPTSASQPVTFTWDFGDGSAPLITTDAVVTYTFPTTNTYTVLLTTTNGYGGEVTATHQVTVPFDNDGDGLTNATEDALGTDPNDPDSDGDGLTDYEEVNDYGTDPNDADSDDDGLTDYEEVNDYGTDPNDADSDDDGLTDGEEVNTYNTDPNVDDTDGDGMPDGWEVDNGLDPLDDEDADEDPDADGLSNLEEYQNSTDPNDDDTDNDGMPDGWEVDNNLDPLVDDADGNPDADALTNLEEYQAGTDPHDYNPSDISLSNASVAENQPASTMVGTFSTIDLDDDTHIYSLVSGAGDADNGSFAIVSATLQTSESFDYETKDSYTIRVQSDDGQATISETFAITVTNINDAPAFTSTPVTTATEEVAYEYVVTAEDVDAGDAVSITALTLPGWLDLTGDGGVTETLSGTPANDDVGEHLIELHVEDLAGATATQAFTITVANVNDAPVFTSTPVTTATQDASYSYPVAAADVDADDVLAITAESLPGWLTLVDHGDGTATLSGTPANADVGDHAMSLLVTDAGGLTDTQSFTITVANINDAPIFTSTPITTATEEVAYEHVVTAEDVDVGDAVSITAVLTLPSWLDLTSDGGVTETLSGTPTNDDVGEHLVALRVEDLSGATDTQAFTITVANVNDAPVFTSTPVTTATQDASYSYPVAAADVDADEVLTITAESLPAWLTLGDHGDGTATLSGTPANADVGDHAMSLLVTDAGGLTDTQAFAISVANVNDAPAFTSTPVTTATEEVAYEYVVTAEDVDVGDAVSITAVLTLPSWLDLTSDGGVTETLSGTPTNDDVGEHLIALHVEDLSGATDTQAFTITVANVNDAPVFTSTPVTTATQDASYSYPVAAADVDADEVLTITAESLPGWLTLVDHGDGTATLSGTPANADVGDHAMSLLVTDAGGLTDTQAFAISVANVNDAPAFTSTPVTTATEEVAYEYVVTAEDVDVGDAVSITAVLTLPGWLDLTSDGGATETLSGTPTNDDVGEHLIALRVEDLSGATDTQAFTITVANVNDAPVFTSTPVTTATQDASYSYPVAAADVDADEVLTITAESLPGWLTLVDHGDGTATLSGTPANADVGDHAIPLLVTDAGGLTDTQAFTIIVANVNDAPIFTSTPVMTALLEVLYTYNVAAMDGDPGDVLTFTAPVSPTWLTLTQVTSRTATLSGTPANADVGDHAVSLLVTDAGGLTATQAFTISVANVNDAPAFTSTPITTATEEMAYEYVVTAEDVDAGDVLTITAESLPAWLTLGDHGDGTATLSGTPANADVGDHAVSLLVTDAGGLTATQAFTITVANVNDAPTFTSTPVVTAALDVMYTYEVEAEDVDVGDVLTITAKRAPDWLTLEDHEDGTATLSGTPRDGEVEPGDYDVTLEVYDQAGASVAQSFTLEVKLPGEIVETEKFIFLPLIVRNF